MTTSPSTGRFSSCLDLAPVATITLLVESDLSASLTATEFLLSRTPVPSMYSTLFFFRRKATPLVSFSTTCRLRSIALPKSGWISLTVIPKSAALLNKLRTSAFLSNALLGMQPQLRQTPPTSSFSTNAVFRPSWPARIAATYPPGPPPMTTRS